LDEGRRRKVVIGGENPYLRGDEKAPLQNRSEDFQPKLMVLLVWFPREAVIEKHETQITRQVFPRRAVARPAHEREASSLSGRNQPGVGAEFGRGGEALDAVDLGGDYRR
jgi:hypothetical protein